MSQPLVFADRLPDPVDIRGDHGEGVLVIDASRTGVQTEARHAEQMPLPSGVIGRRTHTSTNHQARARVATADVIATFVPSAEVHRAVDHQLSAGVRRDANPCLAWFVSRHGVRRRMSPASRVGEGPIGQLIGWLREASNADGSRQRHGSR